MLTVGVDTYVTIEEANEYIAKFYTTTDSLRIQWEAMPDEDKEVYLRRAFQQINKLPYTGCPKNPKQTLPFPRKENWGPGSMDAVKAAQVEQGFSQTNEVANQEFATRIELRRAGVTSYRIGDLSETFESGMPSDSNGNFFGLAENAYNYLSKWLTGGYRVCTSTRRRDGRKWLLPL